MKTPSPFSCAFLAAFAFNTASSHAALLVHESFSGYTVGNLGSQAATGTGLTGNWAAASDATYDALHQVTASGLTFSGLATSGGALTFTTNATRFAGAALALSAVPTAGSTLFSSYLVNLTAIGGNDSGVGTRINVTAINNTSSHFGTFADSRAGNNVGVSYDNTFNPANSLAGTTALATGQTFIIISSYSNINNGNTVGTATLHALNQSQYASYLSSGNDFATYSATASIGTAAGQIWAAASSTATFDATFDNTDFFQILSRYTTGTIDEIRYGTSHADVLPIPEPAASLLLAAAALVGTARRRRDLF